MTPATRTPFRPAGLFTTLLLCLTPALADVIPASLFCDHAVLQQGKPLPVWGSAEDGEQVTVTLCGQQVSTIARQGAWSVVLAPMQAGGPHTLFITGKNRVEIRDILIGEVWVCGGQSNMERQLGLRQGQQPILNWEAEAAAANYPQIRHFGVAQSLSLKPETRVGGSWRVCTPQAAPDFTAVGFFFGRALHLARGTPIGLIHSSWGGTPAESWTSAESLSRIPAMEDSMKRLRWVQADPEAARAEHQRSLREWFIANDPGASDASPWSAPAYDTAGWGTMRLPTYWENAGQEQLDGVVWFRKEVTIPETWQGKDVQLYLGAIDDHDTTFVNGTCVGSTSGWTEQRVYRLPAHLLKPGRNVIAVRVLDTGGNGGLWGGGGAMKLVCADTSVNALPLEGEWHCKTSMELKGKNPPPIDPTISANSPTVLHNAMIAPLQPYAIQGVVWYQGEANSGDPMLYRTLFPALVADWRHGWKQGNFPFLYVQIAPMNRMPPEIREAQRVSLEKIPNSAMIVTIDVGDAEDIHPTNKKPVGERLALAARALAHGEQIDYSGPALKSCRMNGNKGILTFTHLGGGLVAQGTRLDGFTIAGDDGVFHAAHAEIRGETIEVSAPEVGHPKSVRYGWANVAKGNLYNKAGLPASPFTTETTSPTR